MKNLLVLIFLTILSCTLFGNDNVEIPINDLNVDHMEVIGDPIVITLYGKGGIVSNGDKNTVCPEQSSNVCSKVEILSPRENGDNISSDYGKLIHDGSVYKVKQVVVSKSLKENKSSFHTRGSNFNFKFVNR